MNVSTIFILIIAFLLFDFFFGLTLDFLNASRRDNNVPDGFQDVYDADRYRKAMEYDRVNQRFSLISGTFSLVLLLVGLFTDFFATLELFCTAQSTSEIVKTLYFAGIIALISGVISLPFSIYHTFVIEERFGFNKMKPKTFILDLIKSVFLTAILGGGLIAALVTFYQYAGEDFWLYAWILISVIMIFFSMFYTSLIVPLFNKLSPLPEGELRDAISKFAAEAGFHLKNIYMIDGSKRSSKANAYFSGFGKGKKIVLYDTLIKDITTDETVAVLAHEAGHFHLKHMLIGLFSGLFQTAVLLFIFSLFIDSSLLSQSLGGSEVSFRLNALAFAFLFSPISTVLGILGSIVSRRHEYRADAYAASKGQGENLISSLKKLSVNHLSNLRPHPLYVFVHYSHPPLISRINAIRKLNY
ncbi:MAG: M48 family metallopeptidase [Bacteroidota bacterium]